MSASKSDQRKERKCFIITPVGEPLSQVRRHIDGIIDAAIIPALEKDNNNKYEIIVPHRSYDSTAITKQIYVNLYESDLVIANLTELNPNVMYELAIRFCFGKPVIIITDDISNLPFDVKDQRALAYTNDAKGTIELREDIGKALETVDFDKEGTSPIHDAINEAVLFKIDEKSGNKDRAEEMLTLIMKKLDSNANNTRPVIDLTKVNAEKIAEIYKSKISEISKMLSNIKPSALSQAQLDVIMTALDELEKTFDEDEKLLDTTQRVHISFDLVGLRMQCEQIKKTVNSLKKNE